jgi:hypothetical protein
MLRPTDASAHEEILGFRGVFQNLGMFDRKAFGDTFRCFAKKSIEVAGSHRLAAELRHDFAMTYETFGVRCGCKAAVSLGGHKG